MTERIVAPPGAVESPTAFFWFGDDGIIYILNKLSASQDLEDAEENIRVLDKMAGGIIAPLMIDITDIRTLHRGARETYAKAGAFGKVKAVALISGSSLSRLVGNFFIGFNKPDVPTKLFGNCTDARVWLKTYL